MSSSPMVSEQFVVPTLQLDPLRMPLTGLHLIEASAGTGKSWTLAALYVRLVLGHLRPGGQAAGLYPPQILVMTFTEAATAELRGRIRARLAQAAQFFQDTAACREEPDAFLISLRNAYDPDRWPDCAYRLDMAAQWMDDAAIFTIHGWSSRMLKTHAFDSASLFQQSHVQDSQQLKLQAVQDYWRHWFYPVPVQQLDAILGVAKTPEALLKVLETHWTLAEREPYTPSYQGDAPDVLLQSWGAWKRPLDSLEALVRSLWTEDVIAAVQAAAQAKVLKGYHERNLNSRLNKMAAWFRGDACKREDLKWFSLQTLLEKGWHEASAHTVFAHIDALCEHLRAQPDIAQSLLQHAADEVGQTYRANKARLAQFDFSDLLQRLYHALDASGRLAQAIAQQYPVALVDEFQDTDPWQYGALSKIYGASSQTDTGLIMIGDPKQAIYSFRGADLATYLRARAQVQAIHTLNSNFRSTPELVAAVNHVFSLVERPFSDVPFVPVVARKAVAPLQIGSASQPAMTVWHHVFAKKPRKEEFLRHMAEVFASQMVTLLNTDSAQTRAGTSPLGLVDSGPVDPGDMAVLVRDWREARAIRRALSQRGVRSVYLSERDSVYASPEAIDLWRVMRALANPRSIALLRSALSTRLWGLGWSEMEALFQDASAWDAQVERFHRWQQIWHRQGVLPLLHHLLHEQGIAERLLRQSAGQHQSGERQLTNLLHLGDLLQAASLNLQGQGALVRYLEAQIQSPNSSGESAQLRLESDAKLVQVVTVHKCKGLQYPLVFLPFVSVFTATKKDSGKDDNLRLQEDMRLLYVALTRAEKALWLGVAPFKGDLDGKSPLVKSAVSQLLRRQTPDDLDQCLAAWRTCAQICVAPAPAPMQVRYTPATGAQAYKPASEAHRLLRNHWWTASFSALVQHQTPVVNASLPIDLGRDSRMADAQVDNSATPLDEALMPSLGADVLTLDVALYNTFPAGSRYGTLLHDLLEWQAQRAWPLALEGGSATVDAEWQALVHRKSQRLKLTDEQQALLQVWLKRILVAELPLGVHDEQLAKLSLCTLQRAQAWSEMGFTFTVQHSSVAQMDQLIAQHVLPSHARQALQARTLEGMLIGFMDLVLVHQGRYYVLDYKSNRLAAYGTDNLREAVLSHRYDVQYTLYVLALHRLLKHRLPDYDYDRHLGGALYLFLRGIDQPGAGLFADKPPRALIEALDALFAGRNTAAEKVV